MIDLFSDDTGGKIGDVRDLVAPIRDVPGIPLQRASRVVIEVADDVSNEVAAMPQGRRDRPDRLLDEEALDPHLDGAAARHRRRCWDATHKRSQQVVDTLATNDSIGD